MGHPLIAYRCAKLEHQGRAPHPVDNLTIHEGAWAYCAFDVRAARHEWVATGGRRYEELVAARRLVAPPARG